MRAVVEELDLAHWRKQTTRIGHRAGDVAASWGEHQVVESMHLRHRRFEQSDDESHHRREASDRQGGSKTVPLMSVRQVRECAGTPVPVCHTVAR